jgi:hypothetical protein
VKAVAMFPFKLALSFFNFESIKFQEWSKVEMAFQNEINAQEEKKDRWSNISKNSRGNDRHVL